MILEIQQLKQIYSIIASNFQQQMKNIDSQTYYENMKLFLSDQDYILVANNLKKHIMTSNYLPTIADLVRVEKKETEGNPYIPNLQETKAMMALEYTPEPASKEFVEQKKKEIERILEEGRKKHEQRVAAVFEQQRI